MSDAYGLGHLPGLVCLMWGPLNTLNNDGEMQGPFCNSTDFLSDFCADEKGFIYLYMSVAV